MSSIPRTPPPPTAVRETFLPLTLPFFPPPPPETAAPPPDDDAAPPTTGPTAAPGLNPSHTSHRTFPPAL